MAPHNIDRLTVRTGPRTPPTLMKPEQGTELTQNRKHQDTHTYTHLLLRNCVGSRLAGLDAHCRSGGGPHPCGGRGGPHHCMAFALIAAMSRGPRSGVEGSPRGGVQGGGSGQRAAHARG
eukprot:1159817-Pelagomonas_calceolata.AAC.12